MGKSTKRQRIKANRIRIAAAGARGGGGVHPLILQADIPAEQVRRARYEVSKVPNPHGEFVRRDGTLVRHKAVRRVPHFETLYRSKVVDRTVFVVLEWYAERLALAQSGLFRCGLDVSGGDRGSAHSHVPASHAAVEARSDIAWARGFIPLSLRPSFDGVMEDGDTFEAIGRRVHAGLCIDRARRRASAEFKLAANHLLLGIGARLGIGQST